MPGNPSRNHVWKIHHSTERWLDWEQKKEIWTIRQFIVWARGGDYLKTRIWENYPDFNLQRRPIKSSGFFSFSNANSCKTACTHYTLRCPRQSKTNRTLTNRIPRKQGWISCLSATSATTLRKPPWIGTNASYPRAPTDCFQSWYVLRRLFTDVWSLPNLRTRAANSAVLSDEQLTPS